MQIIINAKDKQCPAPLILTKQAINNNKPESEIIVICNNETSKENIITYLKELHIESQSKQNADEYSISFTIPQKVDTSINAENYCSSTKKVRTIVIKDEQMGGGDSTLGSMLMRAFINALPDADILADNIILYNAGVKTNTKNSDTAETYKKLAAKGATITMCGTCIDYYNMKETVGDGTIGNMYNITEILLSSDTIIYP